MVFNLDASILLGLHLLRPRCIKRGMVDLAAAIRIAVQSAIRGSIQYIVHWNIPSMRLATLESQADDELPYKHKTWKVMEKELNNDDEYECGARFNQLRVV